jgi:peptidoglycan hydrolase-like protein with peptidoglycan-binding domain
MKYSGLVLAVLFVLCSLNAAYADKSSILAVQAKLKELGYNPGGVDGIWGAKTTDAVKRFQKDNGLPVTGKLDEPTSNKLGVSDKKDVSPPSIAKNHETTPSTPVASPDNLAKGNFWREVDSVPFTQWTKGKRVRLTPDTDAIVVVEVSPPSFNKVAEKTPVLVELTVQRLDEEDLSYKLMRVVVAEDRVANQVRSTTNETWPANQETTKISVPCPKVTGSTSGSGYYGKGEVFFFLVDDKSGPREPIVISNIVGIQANYIQKPKN